MNNERRPSRSQAAPQSVGVRSSVLMNLASIQLYGHSWYTRIETWIRVSLSLSLSFSLSLVDSGSAVFDDFVEKHHGLEFRISGEMVAETIFQDSGRRAVSVQRTRTVRLVYPKNVQIVFIFKKPLVINRNVHAYTKIAFI